MDIDVKERLLEGFFRIWPGLQVAVAIGFLDDLPSGRVAEHENRVKAIQDFAEFLGVAEGDAGDAAAWRRSPEDAGADRDVVRGVIKFDGNALVRQAGVGSRRHNAAYGIADGQVRPSVGDHGELECLVEVHERRRWHVAAKESWLFNPLAADGDGQQAAVGAAVNPSRLPLGKEDDGLAAQVATAGGLRPRELDMAQIVVIGKRALAQRRHGCRNDDFAQPIAPAEGIVPDGRD
ncbi:MAG: hypothetical protein BWX73_03074 [Lentisphaerae bacterium ADurb.Bin082]|nr:MAG: hypothetical protein BWX73_03074 [Lentisphaerae bacterium ADurb.Bin082]